MLLVLIFFDDNRRFGRGGSELFFSVFFYGFDLSAKRVLRKCVFFSTLKNLELALCLCDGT